MIIVDISSVMTLLVVDRLESQVLFLNPGLQV